LSRTSVSGNTAIYNSSPVFVFLISVFLIKEKITVFKILSVIMCVAGVLIISFTSNENSGGTGKFISTTFGYILVVVSTCLYSLYEVLYHKISHFVKDNDGPVIESARFLGLMGVFNTIFVWVPVVVLSQTNIEPISFPDKAQFELMLFNTFLDSIYNVLLLLGIGLTSPIFISVGVVFTIPVSILMDYLMHSFYLPWISLIGVVLIIGGFFLINGEVIYKNYKSKHKNIKMYHAFHSGFLNPVVLCGKSKVFV